MMKKRNKPEHNRRESLLLQFFKGRSSRLFRALSMALAMAVVFATTYSLILPAITIDGETAEEMPDAAEEMLEAAEETSETAEAMPEASKEASEAVKKTTIAAAVDCQPEKKRGLQLKSAMETCDAFCKRNNMGETERANLFNILQTITDELSGSSLSDETLQKIAHALSYERDVAQAEIRGRNMRIEQLLAQQQATSQIHQLAMTAPSPSRPTPPYSRIGGLSAADRQTIWERGKEKRVRH